MLIVFDKDGTLTRPKSRSKFVQSPDDQELFPGVRDKIQGLLSQGAKIAVASNQGGVAAGHKTLESTVEEIQYCLDLLGLTFGLISGMAPILTK